MPDGTHSGSYPAAYLDVRSAGTTFLITTRVPSGEIALKPSRSNMETVPEYASPDTLPQAAVIGPTPWTNVGGMSRLRWRPALEIG